MNLSNSSDEHHCRCFKINPSDIELCKEKLIELGFRNTLEFIKHADAVNEKYVKENP